MFLVAVMTVAFFIDFGLAPPSAVDVAEGFSFRAQPYATVPALGLIGAVIMPHNIYLHSALVLSRLVDRSNPRKLWEVGSAARGACCHKGRDAVRLFLVFRSTDCSLFIAAVR